jgi:hypothetical protein
VKINNRLIFRGNNLDTDKNKSVKVSITRIRQRTGRRRLRNVIEDYIYNENCIHAAGSNNITGYLVIIIKVEGIRVKVLLDLGYMGNYINSK